MIKLEKWTEITKGLYKYDISAVYSYEIHILHRTKDTDILSADAALYLVGNWTSLVNGSEFFERALLLKGPLAACLEAAVEDEKGEK